MWAVKTSRFRVGDVNVTIDVPYCTVSSNTPDAQCMMYLPTQLGSLGDKFSTYIQHTFECSRTDVYWSENVCFR